jgi:membrane-associated protease RseP (regulator of RpoE activity)
MSGGDDPADLEAESASGLQLHLLLFLLTCGTTFVAGAQLAGSFSVAAGAQFAGTLMTILVCHEMGHYLVARRYRLDVSLPYFIPLPPFISLGTMGAVIRMRRPIADRNQLIDVGAAGPLAGLVAALPLLIIGLALSPLSHTSQEGAVIEGNSLAYLGLKFLVHGMYLPAADGTDVQLHPMAFAAWLGLLITMINLIPIGQLDGGHIASAWLGRRHERLSGWLHRLLLVIGAAVVAFLLAEGRGAGLDWPDSLSRAAVAGMPWLVWAVLLLVMRRMSGGVYHPPVEGEPLSRGRRALALFMVIVFLLLFTPIPLREALP